MFKQFKGYYPKYSQLVQWASALVAEKNMAADLINYPDGQLAIQTDDDTVTDWHRGIGKSTAKTPEWEHQFSKLQPILKDSVVAEYLDWLAVPVYRTRIMVSRPKSCYSIHRDYSPRLHLPLITNKQCYFVFKDPPEFIHMPADGQTYWVDTRADHTFMNGSVENRLHLVMIVKD
jgi:hypothetical protein